MRRAAVLGLIFLIALPALAADKALQEKVTVDQLAERIAAQRRRSDKDLARTLDELELTQRLPAPRRAELLAFMRGDKSRQAFAILADLAEIYDPPATEIPTDSAPSLDDQKAIIARAVDFAATTVQILPRFYAARDTIRFQRESPAHIVREPRPASAWIDLDTGTLHVIKPITAEAPSLKPFRFVDAQHATVLYRGEQEVAENDPRPGEKKTAEHGAETWGEFGPFLRLILTDILNTAPEWLHWEKGETGPLAVFRFDVPRDKSHYTVRYCCVPLIGNLMLHPVSDIPPYSGQIFIDPATGAVMRLLLITRPAYIPIERADIAVEYAFVDLGGKQYLCPRRSVSITLAHPPRSSAPPTAQNGGSDPEGRVISYEAPKTTAINDVHFADFHMAMGEMHVVPEKPQEAPAPQPEAQPETQPSQPPPATPDPEHETQPSPPPAPNPNP